MVIKNMFLAPFSFFTGFFNHHIASSFLKKSFAYAWELYPMQLDTTCRCRLRERTNVNQWLVKDLQFVNGWFENRNKKIGERINLRESNISNSCRWVREQTWKMLCINDNELTEQFEDMKIRLQEAFETILPEKSSYER